MNYFFETAVPYEKTVIEKRAATDDSIRLYEEIKEKAYNSILYTLEINNNLLNISGIVYEDLASYKKICYFVCELNGEKIEDKIEISKINYKNKYEVYRKIVDEVSKRIAIKLISVLEEEDGTNRL